MHYTGFYLYTIAIFLEPGFLGLQSIKLPLRDLTLSACMHQLYSIILTHVHLYICRSVVYVCVYIL